MSTDEPLERQPSWTATVYGPESLPTLSPAVSPSDRTTVLLVSNIHCAACVAYVKEALLFLPYVWNASVSILDPEVRVHHGPEISTTELATVLIDAAFEVLHATTYDEFGLKIKSIASSSLTPSWLSSVRGKSTSSESRLEQGINIKRKVHIEICDACRMEERGESGLTAPHQATAPLQINGPYDPKTGRSNRTSRDVGEATSRVDKVASRSPRRKSDYQAPKPSQSFNFSVEPFPLLLDLGPKPNEPPPVEDRSGEQRPYSWTSQSSIGELAPELDKIAPGSSGRDSGSLDPEHFQLLLDLGLKPNEPPPMEECYGKQKPYSRTSQSPVGELAAELDKIVPGSSGRDSGSLVPDRFSPCPGERCPAVIAVRSESTDSTAVEEYEALLSIIGMTCASCVNAVRDAVQDLSFVKSVTVNLLAHNATLTFWGPESNVNLVVDQINDIGFEATLAEVKGKPRPKDIYVANISISGMTCGSCVGAVMRGVQELPFVTNVSVDLLGHKGTVEFEGRAKLGMITEKIEDLGFDATVMSCEPITGGDRKGSKDGGPTTRTVEIRVDGMFSHSCSQAVLKALESIEDDTLVVNERPMFKKPILKVTYTPRAPHVTIRTIIAAIESEDKTFRASVYHPPTIEDRSRAILRRERQQLLFRLLFSFIVAIPTFVIGIVYMTLVPKTNHGRMYLEEPIWAGSVARLEWALLIITTPLMFYGTDIFHVRALKEIRTLWRPSSRVPILRRFYRFGSMNMLISAGTSVAYFSSVALLIVDASKKGVKVHTTSYFDTVVFLTLFILAGRSLEAYSKAKTGDAVALLGKLRPSEGLLVVHSPSSSGGDIQRVSVDLLEVGDIVNVPHGASPPTDGFVAREGVFKFDESSLTGESMPVGKSIGDKVYCGSVNVGSPVYVEVSEVGSDSMLDQIVAVVREGQTKRAPLERVADVLTAYFVPVITLIAIITFFLWFGLGQSGVLPDHYNDSSRAGWAFWSLQFAIAVFVVSCPCGLALAAPTALFVGGGLAATRGILVKGGGEAFQEASRLDAIVFDKTGTLTEGGTLTVSDHEVLVKDKEQQMVSWALARVLEESSTHPIARAIAEICSDQDSYQVVASSVTEIPGQGMKGTFTVSMSRANPDDSSTHVHYEAGIGNQRMLETLSGSGAVSFYLSFLLSKYQASGKSTAIFALRKLSEPSSQPSTFVPAIVFATSDPVRSGASDVISQLQSRNIDVYMCTGDNKTTAHAVASTIGIPSSNVVANVLPNQKAEFIKQIQNGTAHNRTGKELGRNDRKTIVAFVGDGTNDSPALAAADVSIAMASGSDVAVGSAGFILLNS